LEQDVFEGMDDQERPPSDDDDFDYDDLDIDDFM